MTRGIFLTFEGGEGVGKSTQSRLLAQALQARGLDVVLTREPGGTQGAEMIRNLLLDTSGEGWMPRSEALLFAAARSDHVERLIAPALARGSWVICDRYIDSTLAYVRSGTDEPARLVDLAVLIETAVDDACDTGAHALYIGPDSLIMRVRPAAITRVLQNLIENSRRFAGYIEVMLSQGENGSALIAVNDDGPGIPPEQRAACLQPFQRLDQARGGDAKGAGLGLSIVERIVMAQEGTLELGESRLGGLAVWIMLPAMVESAGGRPAGSGAARPEVPKARLLPPDR